MTKEIYVLCDYLPEEERFGIISQMKRASVSVANNIAEGFGRNSKKEFQRFLSIALGSVYELQTQLFLIKTLGLLKNNQQFNDPYLVTEEVIKMLTTLRKKLSE
jgi:four helix bundle protein